MKTLHKLFYSILIVAFSAVGCVPTANSTNTSKLPKETTFLGFITQKYTINTSKVAFQCKFDVIVEWFVATQTTAEKN